MEGIYFACLLHCLYAADPNGYIFLGTSYLSYAYDCSSFDGFCWSDARLLDDQAIQTAYSALHHNNSKNSNSADKYRIFRPWLPLAPVSGYCAGIFHSSIWFFKIDSAIILRWERCNKIGNIQCRNELKLDRVILKDPRLRIEWGWRTPNFSAREGLPIYRKFSNSSV